MFFLTLLLLLFWRRKQLNAAEEEELERKTDADAWIRSVFGSLQSCVCHRSLRIWTSALVWTADHRLKRHVCASTLFSSSVRFTFMCTALFTMQMVSKQLYRNACFYIICYQRWRCHNETHISEMYSCQTIQIMLRSCTHEDRNDDLTEAVQDNIQKICHLIQSHLSHCSNKSQADRKTLFHRRKHLNTLKWREWLILTLWEDCVQCLTRTNDIKYTETTRVS